MRKKFLLMLTLLILALGSSGNLFAANGNVAKVGNTEYATIDEAIAAWTNNTTLTLLADVTLSDVVTLKSTEHHILDLGTYTLTAASGRNAIVIKACGNGSAEKGAITITADADEPGGINAGSKCVIYYKYADGGIDTEDRPIIYIKGGVFTGTTSTWGTAGIYTIGSAARKCATLNISGGTFNCSINGSGKSKLLVSGGNFNYSVGSQGDSTALRLISGGRFKTLGFMTADSNNTKFWFGTSMGNSNVGLYVDKNGYLCVGGPVITETSKELPAVASNATKWSSYLAYSSAATYGLFYEDVDMAIAKHGEANVTIWEKPAVTIPENVEGDAAVVEEIANNTALDDYTPENLPEGAELEIVLMSVGEEYVYDVTPMANGSEVEPTQAITFRLPVPASVTETYARVYHEETLMGVYEIKGEGNAKYVEIKSADFSVFAVEPIVPVAQIGTEKYATLAEAIEAAQDGETITLIADVELTAQIEIPAGETVTIDLNGKTVNSVFNGTSTTNHIYALSNKGTLTIQDSKGNGSINSRGIYNYGSLTLNAGAINAIDGNGGYAINNESGSTFVMNGGVVAATNEDDNLSSDGGFDATALDVPDGCTATLNGGVINNVCDFTFAINAAGTLNIPATSTITVNGTHGAIAVSGGKTTIYAGTFQIPADEYSRTDNVLYVSGGSLVVNGGTFIGDSDTASGGSCLYDAAGTAVVNGGTFKGSSGGDVWGTTGTTIKGGTFENLIEKQHIAAGYGIGDNGTVAKLYDGEGTETSPYIINDINKLITLRNEVNGGKSYEGVYFKLTSDITLSGEWTAIGNGSRSSKTYNGNAFKGVFDGDNKTISGLTITSTTAADAAIGLFGVVDGGTVKNLNLTEVNINVASSDLAGAAIGMMLNGATADKITVSGAIVGRDGVGGIVGRLIIDGTIANCTNNASVTTSYGGIGGIVGKAYYEDGANTSTFANITNCTNKGTIKATMYVGGIAGLARANVSGCVNEGEIQGGTQTGGILGQLMAAGTVSGNENKAKVTGTSHVGGIIGDYTQSGSYTYNNVTIADNINRGEISATGDRAAILGCNNVDGFAAMTATGNLSYYYVEGLQLFGNPEDMVIDETNKFVLPVVAKIGTEEYTSFADALEAAKSMTGDVTVEICAKVTMNQPLAGSYTSIKFVGPQTRNNTEAEIYLDVQGYITATGKKVAFENLKLSKSEGGFIANAGFMNVAFGIYDVVEVSYTKCTFLNGACASFGKVTYTNCIFNKSWEKYGLWAYGNVDVTVNGCTFANYRGIKMYAENGANASVEKPNLVVKNTNFSAVQGEGSKPAIVLTYGESVTLEGNTYSSTGVFELDLDGKPNGVAVTSDVAPTCINDNGACGVLVDGKIYTTVAQAAEVATNGSTVTLLHDSEETVELPFGVIFEKNGFTADNVTITQPFADYVELPSTMNENNYKAMFGTNTVTDGTNYYATLQAAVEAVAGNADAIIYCKPDAELGAMQHAPVVSTLTVYGNNASVTGFEHFDLGNTDKNEGGSLAITDNMTLTIKNLKGYSVWGAKSTSHIVNLVLEDCFDMGKVFITGTTGTLNIAIEGSEFKGLEKEAIYSNADGAISLNNVAFSNLNKAVNLNHKAAGTQTVTINGCSFTDCGADVAADQIPVRVLSSVDGGKSVLNVSNTTFSGTPTGGADILLPNDKGVTDATIQTTAANIKEGTAEMKNITEDVVYKYNNAVAKIGETPYASLQAAVNAAVLMSGDITIEIMSGTYAEDIKLTNDAITTGNVDARPNITFKPVANAEVTLAGTTTLGYRQQNVGASMWNGKVTFDGIIFNHGEDGKHSLDIQDVKGIALNNCKVIGDGEYGIGSNGGNATTDATFTSCTFENGAMQVLGQLGAHLVVDNSIFTDFSFNVQGGATPGMTIKNSTFNMTLTDAHVDESFYAVRTNACPVNIEETKFNIDSEVSSVAADQAKWGIFWARQNSNAQWNIAACEVNLTDEAMAQSELLLTKNAATTYDNAVVRIIITDLTSTSNSIADLAERTEGCATINGVKYLNGELDLTGMVAHIGEAYYATFAEALAAVENGQTITLIENVTGDEKSTEIEFEKDINFTITGIAPAYALPVVTFQNAEVTIKDAEILIPELDARQNAVINIVNSTVHDAGGNSIAKSYYNGTINIDENSTVYMMQITTMGYINVAGTVNATWKTNVYGNGMISLAQGAEFNTGALHLTGQDYSGRDNTDADRVGKPATIVVDAATLNVGNVKSDNGSDYSYNSKDGINVGTIDGKLALLDIKNGGAVNFHMANGETTNFGAGATVNVAASTLKTISRDENGTVTLDNQGTVNVTGVSILDVKKVTGGSKAINATNTTLADVQFGGAVNAFGTNNISGISTIGGILSLGYGTNPTEQVVVNITGNFNGTNVLVYTNNGVDNILNVGKAEGERTTVYFGQLGAFADVNVVNADVTYGYAFIRNDFNATNSTFAIKGGVNTYLSGNAKVVLDNTTWNLSGYANIGSYGGYMYGNADVTLKNGSSMTATSLGIEVSGEKVVKLTLEDNSSLTAKNLTNQGTIVLASEEATLTSNECGNVTTSVADMAVLYKNGKYTLVPPIAKIDGTPYATLQAAVNAAKEGETITLLVDVEQEDGVIITDKKLTIDLNDKTFTVTNGASTSNRNFKINGASVVTIKNGTMVAEGDYSSGAYGTVRTEGTANVTLTGLKLYNYRGNGLNIKALTGTTVAIDNTEIYSEYGGGIEAAGGTITLAVDVKVEQKGMYTAPYNSMAISVNGGGKVTVNGGTYSTECITAEEANNQGTSHGPWVVGVLNSGGTLIINGGTFSNDNFGDNSLATAARGAVLADTGANIEINGGTFNALKAIIDVTNNLGDSTKNPSAVLSGGTFSADPTISGLYASHLIKIAKYYTVVENDGIYSVVKDYVAQVGEERFVTLQEAFNVGGEVVVLKNITLEETATVAAGKEVVLNLNGYTISQEKACTGNYNMILNKGKLTIEGNGKISFKDTGAGDPNFGWGSYTLRNEGTLVVENGTIEHLGEQNPGNGQPNVHMYCAIFQYSGSSTINGGTISTPTYRSARLWNGNMTINGGNFVGQLWLQAVSNSANLTISGGTFAPRANDGSSVFVSNSDYDVTLAVTGGTFDAKIGANNVEKAGVKGSITGGVFSQVAKEGTAAALIDERFKFEDMPNIDGYYSIIQFAGTQTRELVENWNWFSTYIDSETLLQDLKAELNPNGIQIKGQDGYTQFYSGYGANGAWSPGLTSVIPTKMYMIKTKAAVEVELEGNFVEEDREITLNSGWNWIGYPVRESVYVKDAIRNIIPTHGDVIKSQLMSAVYMYGTWFIPASQYGDFYMNPGEGYMYYSNAVQSFDFAYSKETSATTRTSTEPVEYHWIANAAQYPSNMTVIAMLNIDGKSATDNYEIAAFANGECRGSARPVYVDAIDSYVLVMTISGEEVEELTFKYYDVNNGTEYELSNRFNYSSDAILGTADEPYMFFMNTLGVEESTLDMINIYPNPTTTDRAINLQATCDNVEVFNALGVKVAEYQNVDTIDALETAGVYVIRVTINGEVKNCRLVVK